MKSCFFSAVAMALLASCSGSEVDEVIDNGQPVAISLSAGVQTATAVSRAPITGSATFAATILGWEGEAADYAAKPWESKASEIAANATGASLTLTPVRYYSADATVNTYMQAFFVSSEVTAAENGYVYTITDSNGQSDILLAPAVTGNKDDASGKNFAFVHPLTQVKFKIKAGTGLAANTTLTSITLKSVQIPGSLDFSKTANVVQYAAAGDLLVAGISTPAIAAEASVGNAMMISPLAALTLDVVTSVGAFSNIAVKIDSDATLLAGKAYTITLTFNQKIEASASVTDWVDGTGSGTVE